MHAVDLYIEAGKLVGAYEHMRVWLDHEHYVPVDFDQAGDRTGTVHIRVSFVDDHAARAFEREFSGSALELAELKKVRIAPHGD